MHLSGLSGMHANVWLVWHMQADPPEASWHIPVVLLSLTAIVMSVAGGLAALLDYGCFLGAPYRLQGNSCAMQLRRRSSVTPLHMSCAGCSTSQTRCEAWRH